MNENQLKVEKELKDSMTFFCEGLQGKAEPNDLLERYDHYFQMYCNHFELELTTWYDLRIANRDAQVYMMMMPQYVQLVSTPYDYMRYIDVLDDIVTIYQRCAHQRCAHQRCAHQRCAHQRCAHQRCAHQRCAQASIETKK